MPAGFHQGEVASSATAVNAPPIPTARAPTGILRNSPAYLVAWAVGTARRHPSVTRNEQRRAARGRVGLGMQGLRVETNAGKTRAYGALRSAVNRPRR